MYIDRLSKDSQIPEAKVMIIENVVDVIYERLQMEYLLKKSAIIG